MLWDIKETRKEIVDHLASELCISKLIASLLIQRGICDTESAQAYLNPTLKDLTDPYDVSNLRDGAEKLSHAIDNKASIFIFGDYDVDGVTSIVQLLSLLRFYGLNPSYCVPQRLKEGYGLTRQAIDRAFSDAMPELMIVVDCGTNSKASIDYLKSLGVEIIVIDHHQLTESYPDNCILINPHVNDSSNELSAWYNLSASGLVFKFIHGLIKYRREINDRQAYDFRLSQIIDLAGMGVIADLVPLHGENRLIGWYALKHLSSNKRLGIRSLMEVSQSVEAKNITSSDISFRIGPRINASGRLSDASLPIELLLSEDSEFALKAAQSLESINLERKAIERKIFQLAEERIQNEAPNTLGYVLYDETWHPGVVGIVASRISRKFNRPSLVLGRDKGLIKGSGRSVQGIDLIQILSQCDDSLEHWGGHPMAVGLSFEEENLSAFIKSFHNAIQKLYPEGIEEKKLEIDAWLDLESIDQDLFSDLFRLQPFGQKNSEPIFGIQSVFINAPINTFSKVHKKFFVSKSGQGENKMQVISWNSGKLPKVNQTVDLAIRLESYTWNNYNNIRLILVDWKESN